MITHFQSFKLEWTLVGESGAEERRLMPTPTSAGILSHYDFVSKIAQIVRSTRSDLTSPQAAPSATEESRCCFKIALPPGMIG